jgi:hypothetical protein
MLKHLASRWPGSVVSLVLQQDLYALGIQAADARGEVAECQVVVVRNRQR